MLMQINTGMDAQVAGVKPVDGADLGVRFSSFRALDRFDAQTDGINFGLISWPGGSLAEASPDRFGLHHPGLYNPAFGQADLTDMMDFARAHDAGLAIVLPTARYAGNEPLMREEVGNFMADLLSGSYGPLPKQLVFHIGSEHYLHFNSFGAGAAGEYGKVAAAMVEEITGWLSDPLVNQNGIDIDLAVQAGRTLADDTAIRDAFDGDLLAEVDMVLHHRYPGNAEGVDFTLKQFSPIFDAWKADVVAAGGDLPELNLGEWNVASVTRDEALTKYIRDMKAEGLTVKRGDIDLVGRSDTDFENYWQDLLATRDYGIEAPRLYLELFSEYQAEGMGAGSLHAWDMMHAGRASYMDATGPPLRFIGAEMFDMMAESVEGLTVMDISTRNSRFSDDLWTYGYENDDRLVLFLSADEDASIGEVTLAVEGLDRGYAAIWVESLTAKVPEDWMTRFGIPDNPEVDESHEANTYALGHREDLAFRLNADKLTFAVNRPGEVVRVIVARTPEEAQAVAEFAGAPDLLRDPDLAKETAPLPPPGQSQIALPVAEEETTEPQEPADPPRAAPASTPPQTRAAEFTPEVFPEPAPKVAAPTPSGIGSRLWDMGRFSFSFRNPAKVAQTEPAQSKLKVAAAQQKAQISDEEDDMSALFRPAPAPGASDSDGSEDEDDDAQSSASGRFGGKSELATIADALSMGGYGGLVALFLSRAF